MPRWLVSIALALPFTPGVAAAQGGLLPLDSSAIAALAPLRARIDTMPVLRLRTLWGKSVLERPRLVPSGIEYRGLAGEPPRIDGREFLLEQPGHAIGTGAAVGGVLGGALGTALGVLLISFSCIDAERPCSPPWGYAFGFGVLGATTGAAVGSVIGSRITRWHTIYRHPDP